MNEPLAGIEAGGGASVPDGGPIVVMDALIGVKCIRCLDVCQIQHPATNFPHTPRDKSSELLIIDRELGGWEVFVDVWNSGNRDEPHPQRVYSCLWCLVCFNPLYLDWGGGVGWGASHHCHPSTKGVWLLNQSAPCSVFEPHPDWVQTTCQSAK